MVAWTLRAPRAVLAAAVALAAVSAGVAAGGLGYKASRLDLLDPRSSYNQRWLAYLNEFGDRDDLVVVVQGTRPERVAEAAEEVAGWLRQRPDQYRAVMDRVDLAAVRRKGLYYAPLARLQELDQWLAGFLGGAPGAWSRLELVRMAAAANEQLAGSGAEASAAGPAAERTAALARLRAVAACVAAACRTPAGYVSPWGELTEAAASPAADMGGRLTADGGRLAFVLLRLQAPPDDAAKVGAALDRLRRVLADVARRRGDVRIGVTGLPVIEHDEMRTSQRDMALATGLSLAGAGLLFAAGFGGLRYPLMTLAALVLGFLWTLAYAAAAVGHLNILSMAFGAILVGLGVDFGIHYTARYLQLRRAPRGVADSLTAAAAQVGPGIVTGGVTTSLAFFTARLTHFRGVAELGVISGGGVLLCMAAALAALPAMIYLVDRRRGTALGQPLAVAPLIAPAERRPRLTLAVAAAATAAVVWFAPRLRYDHNLLNMQPAGLESVRLERTVLERCGRSAWCAVSMADSVDEAARRKAAFARLATVARVEELASLLPPDAEIKRPVVERLAKRLAALPAEPPVVPPGSAEQLQWELERGAVLARLCEGRHSETERLLRDAAARYGARPPAERQRLLAELQQRAVRDLLARLRTLRAAAGPEAPALEDVPAPLRERFVSRRRWLLKVYARGGIWDMEALERFVRDVERVDPQVTGHPIQAYYASREMQRSYLHASVYAVLVVAAVLMIDLQSVRHCLLAMLPMGLGLAQLCGLLGLLGAPLNPANMIVLPLILGIGVDDGVHVIHDYRRRGGAPYRLSAGTGAAIVLTSATTMVGFGSLMFARHRGLQSLGQVLTLGVFCCLVSSLIVLPALLGWLSRRDAAQRGDSASPPRRLAFPISRPGPASGGGRRRAA